MKKITTEDFIKYFLILFIPLFFILLNLSIYNGITRRLKNPYGEKVSAKSIELDAYLPFDENSRIVKIDADEKYKFNDGDVMPVLDGATALLPVYSAVFNSMYPESAFGFNGTDFTKESYLQKRNTAGAFKAIVDGSSDIVFCAEPSKKQLDFAKEHNVELTLVPIGYEAFVFIVNKNNPVDSLTVEQVKRIFSGEYKYWNEAGGDNYRISPVLRVEGSGSQTAMHAFMGDRKLLTKSNIFSGRAIGYSFRYYVEGIVSDTNIKMLALNGIEPTKENIKNKSYPIFSNFYAIYRSSDSDREDIKKVIDFVLSEKGQEIVEKSGYVGL
ncbi:MAG: substrate-binding domain-containing protein [Treponema sp.]|uniref:PstS family phosphate ABC transporter substrate-binding protein n=1 Tax=Treponema sp. TaxID=166 RepID=UPI00298DEF20|nr:substrate-binding domain-containing protein [Treponema sp.]MBR5933577.1 substrate-binding domain-containing protein [Treponema sp.]